MESRASPRSVNRSLRRSAAPRSTRCRRSMSNSRTCCAPVKFCAYASIRRPTRPPTASNRDRRIVRRGGRRVGRRGDARERNPIVVRHGERVHLPGARRRIGNFCPRSDDVPAPSAATTASLSTSDPGVLLTSTGGDHAIRDGVARGLVDERRGARAAIGCAPPAPVARRLPDGGSAPCTSRDDAYRAVRRGHARSWVQPLAGAAMFGPASSKRHHRRRAMVVDASSPASTADMHRIVPRVACARARGRLYRTRRR